MPNIMKYGKEGIDFNRVELNIQPPNYDKNTEARVIAPQFGGTEHLRPSNFPGYILANTNAVDIANQKSQIMHNFNHKCNEMEVKLSPIIKRGGRKKKRMRKSKRNKQKKLLKKQYTRRRKRKQRYSRKRKYPRRKSRKNKQ